MKYLIILLIASLQLFSSKGSVIEGEKIQDNYQYTTSFNVCVLEKIEKQQKKGKEEDYLTLYDEASSDCMYEHAKRVYKRYRL